MRSTAQSASELTHPVDILRFAAAARDAGAVTALIFVTAVTGGSVRMPGLRMAVRSDGATIGYVSNGCVDGDIVAQALASLGDGQSRTLAYGAGSPAVDLRLPCGGRIDICIVPGGDGAVIDAACAALEARRAAHLALAADGTLHRRADCGDLDGEAWNFTLIPKIRVRIVGMGAETVTLARLALAADMDVQLHSPDAVTVAAVTHYGGEAWLLSGLGGAMMLVPADDPWTACAILFHDHDWETQVLPPMLDGDAFYIGVLGSYRTHQARRAALVAAGVAPAQIDRIRAPIGLVPRLRDAPLLAISVLAEITQCFQDRYGSF